MKILNFVIDNPPSSQHKVYELKYLYTFLFYFLVVLFYLGGALWSSRRRKRAIRNYL